MVVGSQRKTSTDGDSFVSRGPNWLPWTIFILSLAGVAISSYLVLAHLTQASVLACPENGTINCAKVTTSAQSRFLGIPVAYLGLGFFTIYSLVNWPRSFYKRLQSILRLGMALGSVAMVLWLIYAELLIINAICLWCSAVHLITLSIFFLVVYATIQFRLISTR